MWSLALGAGPSGRPAEDMALFAGYLGMTSAVMLAACLLVGEVSSGHFAPPYRFDERVRR